MYSLGSLQAETLLSGAQSLPRYSHKRCRWWAEGQGAAVYSFFGQMMLLKEAEYAAFRGCHLTTI